MAAEVTPAMRRTIEILARRQMLAPALLFLAGHQPLLFFAGQGLALAAPLASMLGAGAIDDWAALLTHPDGPVMLHDALAEAEQ